MRKIVGVLAALAISAPFLYMISVSLMGEVELLRWPPPLLPAAPQLGNYGAAIDALPLGGVYATTAIVATCVALGQVCTGAAAGYAFARLRFAGRDRLFTTALAILLLPTIVLVIPRFLIIDALGWVSTFPGLISTELVSVWGIFLMRQCFLDMPRDVEDAARLDGAGEWAVFWRVMLPMAKPALAVLVLLAFADQWRSFLWPLVVARSPAMYTVEVGLAHLQAAYPTNWPYQMAAAVLVTLPLWVVCLLAQRYLRTGVTVTGAPVRL